MANKSIKCSVLSCENIDNDEFLKFYSFPYKNKELCKEWIIRIGNPVWYMHDIEKPIISHKICEIHFHYCCKTELNSQLHSKSVPTLYLPVNKGEKSSMKCFFEPSDSTSTLEDSEMTTSKEIEGLSLEVKECRNICQLCFSRGILYDINKSMYNKSGDLAAILRYLVPEYVQDDTDRLESICLDCVKQVLTSYITVKQIRSAFNIFSTIFNKSDNFQNETVNLQYPNKIDIKSILNDCDLKMNLVGSISYLPEEIRENIIKKSEKLNKNKIQTKSAQNVPTINFPMFDSIKIEIDDELYTSKVTETSYMTDTSYSYIHDDISASVSKHRKEKTLTQYLKKRKKFIEIKNSLKNELNDSTNDLTVSIDDHAQLINPDFEDIKIKLPNNQIETIIECPKCGKIFMKEFLFLRHMRAIHEPMDCPICEKKQKKCSIHNRRKEIHEYKNRRCFECNLSFESIQSCSRHLLAKHPKHCLICSRTFPTLTQIRRHFDVHHTDGNGEFKCKLCHRKFLGLDPLNRHKQSREIHGRCAVAAKRKPRSLCTICGKWFTNHITHMLKHTKEKFYKCQLCAYETIQKQNLDRHILSHTGYNPYLCTECGQSFRQKTKLDLHMKQHEVLSDPKPCGYCENIFNTKYERNVHLQSHGIRAFGRGKPGKKLIHSKADNDNSTGTKS